MFIYLLVKSKERNKVDKEIMKKIYKEFFFNSNNELRKDTGFLLDKFVLRFI